MPSWVRMQSLSELQPKIEELALNRSEFSTSSTKSKRSISLRKPDETAAVISSTRVKDPELGPLFQWLENSDPVEAEPSKPHYQIFVKVQKSTLNYQWHILL